MHNINIKQRTEFFYFRSNMAYTNSTIMRRFSKYILFSIGGAIALALLITAALTARLAIGPVSVAFMGPRLQESIGESLYYAYDVKFDGLELRWSDGHGNLGLALVGVRVADYSLQDIASVPEIIIGLSPGAVIGGDMKPVAITVIAPKIRWIKTAGGAIKFDIGAKKQGDSGKILEDFLITMAAAPELDEGSKPALPEMRIVDADILIGNEMENSTLRISNGDILIAPHAEGVRSAFEFAVETASEPVHISAEGLYRTKDQRIELAVNFEDLAFNGLGALLPGPVPEWIMSEPILARSLPSSNRRSTALTRSVPPSSVRAWAIRSAALSKAAFLIFESALAIRRATLSARSFARASLIALSNRALSTTSASFRPF